MKKKIAALLIAAAVVSTAVLHQGSVTFASEMVENVVSGDGEELRDTFVGMAENEPEITVAEERENARLALSETPGGQTGSVGDGLFEDGGILVSGTVEMDPESNLPASDGPAGGNIDGLGELLLEDEVSGSTSTQPEGDGISEPDAEQETEPSTEEGILEEEWQGDEYTLEMEQDAGDNREMPSSLSLGENVLTFSRAEGNNIMVTNDYRFTAPASGGYRFALTSAYSCNCRITDELTGDSALSFGTPFVGSAVLEKDRSYSIGIDQFDAKGSNQVVLKIDQVPLPENVQLRLNKTSILKGLDSLNYDITYTVDGKSCSLLDEGNAYGYRVTDSRIEDGAGNRYYGATGLDVGEYYYCVTFAGVKYQERFTVEAVSDEKIQEIKIGETGKIGAGKYAYFRFIPTETGRYNMVTGHASLSARYFQAGEGYLYAGSGEESMRLELKKGITYYITVDNQSGVEDSLRISRIIKKAVSMKVISKETVFPKEFYYGRENGEVSQGQARSNWILAPQLLMGMELEVTYDDGSTEKLRERNRVLEDSQGCRVQAYYVPINENTVNAMLVFLDDGPIRYEVTFKPIAELLSGTLAVGMPVTVSKPIIKYYRMTAEAAEYQLDYASGGKAVPGSVYLFNSQGQRLMVSYGDKGKLTGLKPGETYYAALWFSENLPVTVTLKVNSTSQEACKHTGGKATCLAQAVCSKCGKPYGKKAAHSFSNAWTVDKAATYTTEGLRSHHCTTPGCTATSGSEKIAKAELTLNVGSSLPMKVKQSATIKVSDLLKGDAVTSWKSSDTKVVKVSKAGKVTAQSKTGKATVTLTLKSGYSKKITVKVQAGAVACDKITLNKQSVTLKAGKSFTLKPTASPITCVQKAKYSSSDKKVAAVSGKGKVTAKKKGKATITVTIGKKKATCKVTVK